MLGAIRASAREFFGAWPQLPLASKLEGGARR